MFQHGLHQHGHHTTQTHGADVVLSTSVVVVGVSPPFGVVVSGVVVGPVSSPLAFVVVVSGVVVGWVSPPAAVVVIGLGSSVVKTSSGAAKFKMKKKLVVSA